MIKTYLEAEDIEKMEEAADYLRDKLLVRLLFHLGCRVSEALEITAGDIDFRQGTVTIEHLKARIKLSCPQCGAGLSRAHKYCPGCGIELDEAVSKQKEHRRYRTLPVDKVTLKMLKEYVSRGGPVKKNGRRVLFGINRHRAWQIVRNLAKQAGLPDLRNTESGRIHYVSPHRLRDAFAVHAVKLDDSGDGIRMLQEHLGHQSITTTMRYRKVSGEEQKEWYQRLWSGDKNEGNS